MSETPTLQQPEFVYLLTGQETQTCRVHNRTLIAWDETRGKRKWPTAAEVPNLWQTFIVWHQLYGSGTYTGNFDQFRDECEAIELVEDQDSEADPTQPAVELDSSSSSV
jgi:hypothetical protein